VQDVLSATRGYWPAILLGLVAVVLLAVLLAVGGAAKAVLAGAASAFTGAAVTKAIDIAQQSHTEAAQAIKDRIRDLDETRRLLYAALMAGAAARAQPMLVATIVNALAHHGLGLDPDVASGYLESLEREESRSWAETLLARINDELDSLNPQGRLAGPR
jgi:hypothetical protein